MCASTDFVYVLLSHACIAGKREVLCTSSLVLYLCCLLTNALLLKFIALVVYVDKHNGDADSCYNAFC